VAQVDAVAVQVLAEGQALSVLRVPVQEQLLGVARVGRGWKMVDVT